jgi:ribonuclease BN (tRNA processing enzyme)
MKLIVLGSGTGVPSLERNSPGYYLQALGQECLVDCGSGTLLQLERAGKRYSDLDVVFITHTHPDHIGDLIPLIHALKLIPGVRREKPLTLFGPAGFERFVHDHVLTVATRPKHFAVEVHEVEGEFRFSDIRCLATPTLHADNLNSVAYRFDVHGKVLVLSGDCDYDAGIIRHSTEANLLVLDCSTTDALKYPGHCSAGECGRIACEAKVRRLLLTHLYPLVGVEDTRLEEAQAAFAGDVDLARDLMQVDL